MRADIERVFVQAIQHHPDIVRAAITGSRVRHMEDRFSDLDVLLIARDIHAVSDVRAWLPAPLQTLLCAFHLTHFCTVLLADFQKIDLAIFSVKDPASLWVIHDYEIIKDDGSHDFETQLAQAAARTCEQGATHLNPDVSLDNVLLLLLTAAHRAGRGELLSAHCFLAIACDMVIALETRQRGPDPTADLLDPRRRLERRQPALATTIQDCLFARPGDGITRLAKFLSTSHRAGLTESQGKALGHLLEQDMTREML